MKTAFVTSLAIIVAQCGNRSAPVGPPTIVASIDTRGIDTSLAWLNVDAAGGLWIVDAPDYAIHHFDLPSGRRSDYALPSGAEPHGAVIGDDGALWIDDYSNSELVRVDESGAMKAYPVGSGVFPFGLVKGAGKFWFVEHLTKNVGSMTPDGNVSAIPVPIQDALGGPMARDDDGTIWVGGRAGSGTVSRLAEDGSFRQFDTGGQLGQLSPCPDGGIAYSSVSGAGGPPDPWVTHIGLIDARGRLVYVDYQAPPPSPASSQPPNRVEIRSSSAIVGPPPPPGVSIFACTDDGAWFAIDRKVIGHVDRGGHGKYFPADSLNRAPAGFDLPTARTAWVALGDQVVELSY